MEDLGDYVDVPVFGEGVNDMEDFGDYVDVPVFAEDVNDSDDENPQERQDRFDYDLEKALQDFVNEPSVLHNVIPESDSEGEEAPSVKRRGRDSLNRGNGVLYERQVFLNGIAFKEAVLDYALKSGRNIQQYRYDKRKIGFQCAGKDCFWRVYCSRSGESEKWQITRFNDEHSCQPNGECRLLKVPIITRLFIHKIRDEPEYFMPMKIEQIIMEKWRFSVSRPQCQAARLKALKWIDAEYREQYTRLKDYKAEIELSNPGSSVEVVTVTNEDGIEIFDKFYVCFENLRKSWKETCRPLFGVDGCFLRGKTKGQFLVAVGRDANNAIYPIAWAIVEVEDTENWLWFIQKIKEDLALGDGDGYILKSDRQKGLIKAVQKELPLIEHRRCVVHIYGNLKKKHGKKTEMKKYLWSLAWSYNEADYRSNLDRIRCYDTAVYDDVMKAKPETWCRCFYKRGSYCEDVENNSTESFNATIVNAREKPLIPMLETVARLAMVRVATRSSISLECSASVTPYVDTYLKELYEEASNVTVHRSTNNKFMVSLYGCAHRVSISDRTCSCGRWEISGIACQHSYGLLLKLKLHAEDYVCHWFRTAMWKRNYEEGLIPVSGARFWPPQNQPIHEPPPREDEAEKQKNNPPKEKRKKGVNESPTKKQPKVLKRIMHCRVCGVANHNSRFHKKNTRPQASQDQQTQEPSQGSQPQEPSSRQEHQ